MLRASFLTGITRLTVGSAMVDGLGRKRASRRSLVPAGGAGRADTPCPTSVEFEDETLVMFDCQSVSEVLRDSQLGETKVVTN